MPIYEFYCSDCHMIFSFLSRKIDTATTPACPRCGRDKLDREVSLFAMGGGEGNEAEGDLPVNEAAMEKALGSLASEAERLDDSDPKEAAKLMRRFSDMTGLKFGKGINEAIGRMEAGEDPEQVEAEMGDLLESEDPIIFEGKGGAGGTGGRRSAPARDETLYEL